MIARAPLVVAEPILDPAQPIIDAHHHLYVREGIRYLGADFSADLGTGHNVQATVLVQARAFYRDHGPEAFRPIGETEFAAQVAEEAQASGGPKLCAGIVGFADLLQGDAVQPVLEAHISAGKGRFRGIRHILAWDEDSRLLNPAYPTIKDMAASTTFRQGFTHLAKLGLSFDAWMFFHQLRDLVSLARRFPDTAIVLNHCGGILGAGAYSAREREVFLKWRWAMTELASCHNVCVKIGGLGLAISGFEFVRSDTRPTSHELANAWQPWVHTCIELFGAERCMFESNFPADKPSYDYATGWNAMKRLAVNLTNEERHALFYGSAEQFYRLNHLKPEASGGN